VATRNGLLPLPRRNGIADQTNGGLFKVETTNEATALLLGKKLSDFYTSQGAVLVDAFLAANLWNSTARPEDLEVHPQTKVFISYTDGAPGVMDIPILNLCGFQVQCRQRTAFRRTLQDYRRQLRWHG